MSPELPPALRDRLGQLPLEVDDLELTVSDFGSLAEFTRQCRSNERTERDRVRVLERSAETVQNYLAELARGSLIATEELPNSAALNAQRDYMQLAELSVIDQNLAETLCTLQRVRNQITHDYPGAVASEIYGAAEQILITTPRFLAALTEWLRSLGYGEQDDS